MARMYLDSGGASTNSGTSDNNAPDLSGTGNATCVSSKTFVDANVATATDIITITAHGYTTGTGGELTTTGVLPAGLTLTTLYFLRSLSVDTIALYLTVADANADTNRVDITAAAGGGNHTFNNHTINLGGAPNLSGVKTAACRVTTTGTSHVITMNGDGVHGLTTGDAVFPSVMSGGTMPTGLTLEQCYYANVLSSTTVRLYSTKALAVAGGASDLNVSTAGVRTLYLLTEVQAAIKCASATNTNRKNFWAKAVDNTNGLFIGDVNVTGLGAGSDWTIGGRVNASGVVDLFNNIRFGDEVIFNTDISGAINANTRITGGVPPGGWQAPAFFYLTGKTGARRLFVNTGNGLLLDPSTGNTAGNIVLQNIELQSQGTGAAIGGSSNFTPFMFDVIISDSGAVNRFGVNQSGAFAFRCGFYNGFGHDTSNASFTAIQCLFRDLTGDGMTASTSVILIGNVFDRCSDRCIENSASAANAFRTNFIIGNTFYRSDNSGYEETSPGHSRSALVMLDNIFKDCGDGATEACIEILQTARRPMFFRNNLLSIAGGRGGVANLGYVLDATDLTSDPLFVDPDAAAGSRDFGLKGGSPAKSITYAFPGSLSVSYRDLGAVQSFPRTARAQTHIGLG